MRLFLAVAVLGISTAACEAQNVISGQLLAASQAERNFGFTAILRINNEKCDFVMRTQFNGSVGEIDNWDAKCLDGNTYSFGVPTNVIEVVQLMNCKELKATNIMMGGQKQLCFGMGSRRRSAPQVSDLIDTGGVTRARLFTVKTTRMKQSSANIVH